MKLVVLSGIADIFFHKRSIQHLYAASNGCHDVRVFPGILFVSTAIISGMQSLRKAPEVTDLSGVATMETTPSSPGAGRGYAEIPADCSRYSGTVFRFPPTLMPFRLLPDFNRRTGKTSELV
ncbi:hypothetical protein [Komagataeibacter kakiaceti]|uniref:hypothetical protein n=1 Tax=Komagataeibacter kakiaceti TaxID=943261 RepID=UPI0004702DE2|nr:hypothetical protein [Komagataeibacter kakiaceti]